MSKKIKDLSDRTHLDKCSVQRGLKAELHDETGGLIIQGEIGPPGGTDEDFTLVTSRLAGAVAAQLKCHLGQSDLASMNAALALVNGFNPRDETEVILAVQMATNHLMIMNLSRKAMIPEQDWEIAGYFTSQATKLMRVFNEQLNTLEKYRGKSQQKVTVEHINVNEGGQAVVGNVDRGGGK